MVISTVNSNNSAFIDGYDCQIIKNLRQPASSEPSEHSRRPLQRPTKLIHERSDSHWNSLLLHVAVWRKYISNWHNSIFHWHNDNFIGTI